MHDFFDSLSVFTPDAGVSSLVVLAAVVVGAIIVFVLLRKAFGFVTGLVFAGLATGAISVSQIAGPIMEAVGR